MRAQFRHRQAIAKSSRRAVVLLGDDVHAIVDMVRERVGPDRRELDLTLQRGRECAAPYGAAEVGQRCDNRKLAPSARGFTEGAHSIMQGTESDGLIRRNGALRKWRSS
jgi:hypothetical protein